MVETLEKGWLKPREFPIHALGASRRFLTSAVKARSLSDVI
jgi:hypothetical protein